MRQAPPDEATEPTTGRGRATRARIVDAAAALMYEGGVGGTGTPAIRERAGVSSSQIYHYFADKDALTAAVISHQVEAVVAAQATALDAVTSLADLRRWRDSLVAAARADAGAGGCPLGSLTSELADGQAWARNALSAGFDRWSAAIHAALTRLDRHHALPAGTDVDRLSAALLAAIQGGLLLAQAQRDTTALEAAVDTCLATVGDANG